MEEGSLALFEAIAPVCAEHGWSLERSSGRDGLPTHLESTYMPSPMGPGAAPLQDALVGVGIFPSVS